MDLTPSAFDGLKHRAARLARRFSSLHDAPETMSLFHRALLRFPEGDLPSLSDRDHFFRSWSRAMRSVLTDLYRRQQRHPVGELAGGGGEADATQDDAELAQLVDTALAKLAEMDPVAAKIVHLRHFEERGWQDVADQLALSYGAVQRKWTAARAWLRAELTKHGHRPDEHGEV